MKLGLLSQKVNNQNEHVTFEIRSKNADSITMKLTATIHITHQRVKDQNKPDKREEAENGLAVLRSSPFERDRRKDGVKRRLEKIENIRKRFLQREWAVAGRGFC